VYEVWGGGGGVRGGEERREGVGVERLVGEVVSWWMGVKGMVSGGRGGEGREEIIEDSSDWISVGCREIF